MKCSDSLFDVVRAELLFERCSPPSPAKKIILYVDLTLMFTVPTSGRKFVVKSPLYRNLLGLDRTTDR